MNYFKEYHSEPLILEPEDYPNEEWATILKMFGMEEAERIVVSNYTFEAYGKVKPGIRVCDRIGEMKTGYCPICDKDVEIRTNHCWANCPDCGHYLVMHSKEDTGSGSGTDA